MATITRSRRRQRRYSVSRERSGCVEFEYPSPNGRHYRLALTNVSASGISFAIEQDDEELSYLESGANLNRATVRIGDCMIRGDMVVMHVTSDSESRHICGALLYPESDTDLVKLKSVLAGMEAASDD